MAAGSIENISGGLLLIKRIGWFFPTAHTETITAESLENDVWVQAQTELETLVGANDIRIRDESNNIIAQADIGKWLFSVEETSIPPGRPQTTYIAYILAKVPRSGSLWLSHTEMLTHTEVSLNVPQVGTLKSLFIATNVPETNKTYDVQVWNDPILPTRTVFVQNTLITQVGQLTAEANNINLPIAKGEYGLRLVRTTGPNDRSDFTKGIVQMTIET
jgi:hypothetical protein